MKLRKIIYLLVGIIFIPVKGSSQEAMRGLQIYEKFRQMPLAEREKLVLDQIIEGNLPDFLLEFREITSIQPDATGKERKVTIFVSPQYLSVGTKMDYFIVPMSPKTAQKIAMYYNASLPTPKVVDLIYKAADLKIEPFTYIPRGDRNENTDIFYDHSKVIQAQIRAAGYSPDTFVAGHKKDIVISSKLEDKNRLSHVTIYGWHLPGGKAIQPESNIHIDSYVDYSHGVRLISSRVLIDGKEFNYEDVLKDNVLFTLLIDSEMPLQVTRYQ